MDYVTVILFNASHTSEGWQKVHLKDKCKIHKPDEALGRYFHQGLLFQVILEGIQVRTKPRAVQEYIQHLTQFDFCSPSLLMLC